MIFTIGHSNRSLEDFIDSLKQHEIDAVVDVRRFPTSKWEWFKRENLQASLALKGVRYVYLGDLLGGFRKGGYEQHTTTEAFALGLEKVVQLAGQYRLAVMCSERFAFRCHRRFIGKALQARGFRVIHVVDAKRSFELKQLGP